jgi:predicted Zn-dependent protease with MMP-like domain
MDEETRKLRKKVKKLWKVSELTFDEICDELGMEPGELNRLAEEMDLGERPECDIYIPTPEEIRLRAAAIRANWTQAEREARIERAHSVTITDVEKTPRRNKKR